MIRLLGAITGSALALATLLVVIGIPQFKSAANDVERAIVTLPLPTSPVDPPQMDDRVAAAENINGNAVPDHARDPILAELEAPSELPPPGTQLAESASAEAQRPAMLPAETPLADPLIDATEQPVLIDDAQSWYAFWSPFRSELAANGFIEQLQSVTGLDYRVVRVKPGVYEVAFAYQDDKDISVNLTQITAATGLELPE